jgi:hypothetical protein
MTRLLKQPLERWAIADCLERRTKSAVRGDRAKTNVVISHPLLSAAARHIVLGNVTRVTAAKILLSNCPNFEWSQTGCRISLSAPIPFRRNKYRPAVFFRSTADRVTSPEQVVLASDGVGSCLS